ncbi:peptidase M20 [Caldanaerobacter subterraneus subsp. yonseiensis KB-1]|uniref:Peptidase M20 n=1 Tax=Caldanaerobacter subterraneus subsp. yonseiensis KB-1 TaxID=1388761 RepID=U5CII3_CALSX|nr:amidohydrolase [Caldanaerobacter subterraneus]ERM92745.1 peptidase M20 [Caldanaerobacter subterraneus subsp. yonseiensis KB-1]
MDILKEVEKVEEEIIGIRRKIHMHPELGFEEVKTSELVYNYLKDIGLEVKRLAKTGVVGLLKGDGERTIAIRADMDALPIQEENEVEYASKIPGKMHACGHDVHTAILLGTAKVLSRIKNVKGNVKFIFQPAEETTGGALPMIEEGVLEGPRVDAIIGLHVDPDLEVGQIGITYGKAYASSDMFDVIIKGRSSHGAEPHKGIDALVIAANVISALQTFASRKTSPFTSIVVTVGTIKGGYARNIIADRVEMSGIIRMMEEERREEIVESVEKMCKDIAKAYGGDAEFRRVKGYPLLINDKGFTNLVKKSASMILGEENVLEVSPSMGVEDFAYFLQRVPGTFYKLGCGNKEKGIDKPLHSSRFDVDERCIKVGIAVHVMTVLNYFEGKY